MKVLITGTSGKVGYWTAREFQAQGWQVFGLDQRAPGHDKFEWRIADLSDLGQVYGLMALFRPDAVVHLAAIPWPGEHAPDLVFRNNALTTYNVLQAAADLGVRKVVTASSESAYGLVFHRHRFSPLYLPLDEAHPLLPQDPYGLSKQVGEAACAMFHRQAGIQAVSFRISHVMAPNDYRDFEAQRADPLQPFLFWSYVDVRDVATACRQAVETDGLGAEAFLIAAPETKMTTPTRELLAQYWPGVKDIRAPLEGTASCLSTAKAARMFGFRAQRSWRQYVAISPS